jgi:hypothetical protein
MRQIVDAILDLSPVSFILLLGVLMVLPIVYVPFPYFFIFSVLGGAATWWYLTYAPHNRSKP